jgi:hypothetical protein
MCTYLHCSSWGEPGQRKAKQKINGIKYLAKLLQTVTCGKNRFKNKDLQEAVKVLGELPAAAARTAQRA